MYRILFFVPSWQNFGHFALPFAEMLAGRYEIVFLHSERAVYRREEFPDLSNKGVRSVDLHTLSTYSLISALRQLAPDCVVVHDKGWPQERALLHAAKVLGIPSLHIQHGIAPSFGKVKTERFFKRACDEGLKTLRTLRVYNATLFRMGLMAWLRSIPFQFRLLINPMDYCFNTRNETVASRACIIGERDRAFFLEKEGYCTEQLVPMGAVEFEAAYAMDERQPAQRVLIISQPLFEEHILKGGMAAKERHIREIIDASPLPVAVKPHPRENLQWYIDHFNSDELMVYSLSTPLNEAIQECSHVIGYFSTALINALILKRPVGIVRWVEDYADVLNLDRNLVATRLGRPDDIKTLLNKQEKQCDPASYAFNKNVSEVLTMTIETLIEDAPNQIKQL